MRNLTVPAGSDLIQVITDLLPAHQIDYSQHLVVFPGKRPAHFLRKSLAQRNGTAMIPPRILSFDTLVLFVCEQTGHQAVSVLDLDAVGMLFDIQKKIREFEGKGYFSSIGRFLPVGLQMLKELEELKISGVSPDELNSMNPATRNVREIYDKFYRRMESQGQTTRALSYTIAATAISQMDFTSFDSITLVESKGTTKSERAILDHISRLEQGRLIHQGAGDNLASTLTPRPVVRPSVHIYKSPDTHAQMFGLSALIQKLKSEGREFNERTVIVLPSSESLFPAYQFVLSGVPEESYNISLGYPVTRTPVYGFLAGLMQAIRSQIDGRFFAPDYVKFILHPYTKNIRLKESAELGRILAHNIELSFLGTKAKRFFTLESLETDDDLMKKLARQLSALGAPVTTSEVRDHLLHMHDQTLRKLTVFSNVRECADKMIEALLFIGEQSTAQLHWLFHPFFRTIVSRLEELGSSVLGKESLQHPQEYFALVHAAVESAVVPFAGTPLRGIQVLGPLETRHLRFDTVIVLDANDNVFPGQRSFDLLLTEELREKLHLPGHHERDAIAHHHWEMLLSGAEEVHCYYVDSGSKPRSRFLERLIWEKQLESERVDEAGCVESLAYSVQLSNPAPEPIVKSRSVIEFLTQFEFSATALDTYLTCGLKFYYAYVLGMREKGNAEGDIERVDIGRFVHSILANIYAGAVGRLLRDEDLDRHILEQLVERKFAEEFGQEEISGRFLLRTQVQRHLIEFVADYQRPLLQKQQIEIVGLEEKIETTWSNIRFKAFVDRVERRNGITYILDYKTGGDASKLKVNWKKFDLGEKATWPDAIGSLQLPLYMILYNHTHGVAAGSIQPAFLMLGTNKIDEKIEVPLFGTGQDPEEYLPVLQDLIQRLHKEISDSDVPFMPPQKMERSCPHCPFTTICGTRWVEEPVWY